VQGLENDRRHLDGLHAWFRWEEDHPGFCGRRALPLPCNVIDRRDAIRMFRRLIIDGFEQGPGLCGGETMPNPADLKSAGHLLPITARPGWLEPLTDEADAPTAGGCHPASCTARWNATAVMRADPNDTIYQFDASALQSPAPRLRRSKVPVFWINSAMISSIHRASEPRSACGRNCDARFVLVLLADQTRGHGTHHLPSSWKDGSGAVFLEDYP